LNKLLDILSKIKPHIDFETNKNLMAEGILDSFDIITLIGDINESFDVNITVESIVPEHFNSVEAIYELIIKLKDNN
jgi:D-alanine--poly(phosphoribitol) ligase subunit 2